MAGDGSVRFRRRRCGWATAAFLDCAWRGLALDASGNLYIADTGNGRIREVNLHSGVITTVAGSGAYYFGSFPASTLGDGGPATAAVVAEPYGVAVDAAGNLYVADAGDGRIRKVNAATGIITTVAGGGNNYYLGDGGPATAAGLSSRKAWPSTPPETSTLPMFSEAASAR